MRSSWIGFVCLGLVLGGCASGSGEGFGGFGAAPQGGGDGLEDDEGETESADDDDDDDDDMGSGSAEGDDDDDDDDDDDNGSTGGTVECDPACAADEECIDGTCFPGGGGSTGGTMECHDTGGAWEACLDADDAVDTSMCGGDSPTCLTGGDPAIVGACSWECTDECDCPEAPASGTAPTTCSDITGSGTSLCSLDCAAGTCPTGMTCFAELACVWEGGGAAGEPYGDCFNNGLSICGLEGVCLQDGDDMTDPTISVCTQPCNVDGDCAAGPGGGTAPVSCTDVTGEGDNECILDCAAGQTCPAGMTCFGSLLCAYN